MQEMKLKAREIGLVYDAKFNTAGPVLLRFTADDGRIDILGAQRPVTLPPHLVARPLPSTLKTGDCFRVASQPFIVKDSYPWGVMAVSPEGVQVPFNVAELASATVLI